MKKSLNNKLGNMIKKKNSIKIAKTVLIICAVLAIFIYGVGVGKFSWPPHDTIKNAYTSIFTATPLKYAERLVGYEVLIATDSHRELVNVVRSGKDKTGYYIETEKPIKYTYSIGSEVRLSDNEYYSEIKGSLDDFKEMGFNVKNFTYPWNANDEIARGIVSEYYESARASGNFKGYKRGVNLSQKPLEKYALYSAGIDNASEEKVTAILEEIVEEKALGIVYFHSDRTTERRIRYLISTAIKKEIDIITRSEALERFANSGNTVKSSALVIEYDDSPWTDYILAFPVHQNMQDKHNKNVPGNIAAVSENIATSGRINEARLTSKQLQEMVDAGWEVVSHSRTHAYLRSVLSTDNIANANDSRIYVTVR